MSYGNEWSPNTFPSSLEVLVLGPGGSRKPIWKRGAGSSAALLFLFRWSSGLTGSSANKRKIQNCSLIAASISRLSLVKLVIAMFDFARFFRFTVGDP